LEVKLAKNVQEAIAFLNEAEGGQIIAGGTDVMVGLNANAVPDDLTLVHIGDIDELKYITETEEAFEIGSLTTDTMLCDSEAVREKAYALWQAAYQSAGPQVRNRATVGGNIGTASPAADVVCALEALDADAVIAGPDGEKTVKVASIITGPKKVNLQKGEIITKLIVPKAASAFNKIGKRQAVTISIANTSTAVEMDGDIIKDIRIVIGSVAATHVRAEAVEAALKGQKADAALIEEKSKLAADSINPITDQRATAWYRKQIVPVLVARSIKEACKKGGWTE